MLDNETKRRIDTCRDILVGKVPDPKSQVEQISIALIYKFMDDMDREAVDMGGKAGFFTGEYEKYAWSRIFDPRLGGFDMLALYSESITRMSQNPGIPQLFRDIFKNAYLPYRDPETLKLFLKSINEFNYDHSERLGDAFEYLLSVLGSQGDAGQFRTPRHIIDFMVEVVKPQKHETILDPACGTAGFLVSSYKHILRANTKKIPGDQLKAEERKKLLTNFKGYDISPDMVRLSLVNLYLHGFVQPQVMEYDTLTSEDRWNEYADVILANPPFMSPKGGIKPHKKFSVQSNRSEVLFVDYIAEHLTPTGRAAVIVPEGIIFQSANAYKQLRKYLVDEGYIYAVVSLPAGVFNPYSGVKTSILLMDKTIAKKAESILFIKVDNDGFGLGAQRRAVDNSNLPWALDLINSYVEGVRSGKTFNTDKLIGNAILVSKETLAENGEYNLTGERHRVLEKKVQQKWPMVKLGDVCLKITDTIDPSQLNGDVIYIGLENIESNSGNLTGNLISNYSSIKSTKNKFLENDILYGKLRPNLNKVFHANSSGICSTDIYVFRSKENYFPKFLERVLRSEIFNSQVLQGLGGAQLPRVNFEYMSKIKIPLPPLDIQSEIVAEIEGYQKIIDGAQQVVDNWKPQIDIDPDWPMVKLGDIINLTQLGLVRNKGEQGKSNDEYSCPYIKMDCITISGDLDLSKIVYINATSEECKKYSLNDGDFIYNTRNTPELVGKSAVYHGENTKYIINNNIQIVRFDISVISDFINYLMNLDIGKKQIKSLVSGTTSVAAIYQREFSSISLPLPDIDVQCEIVSKIESERNAVNGCREIIRIYEDKIKRVIDKVWED